DRDAAASHLGAARDLGGQLRRRVPAEHQAAYAADPLQIALRPAGAVTTVPPSPGAAPPAASPADPRYRRLLGTHPRMTELRRLIDKIAPHESLVLIRGESGTGKELVADALHAGSPRRDRPLLKINCGALVESLLLSELFGHERGAFTGAVARKKGRFEAADGGTLFLDEIGDISLQTQVALLRVLSEGELVRVGGTQPLCVDVRILCATHRDLETMVARGQFREDLYHRLRGLTVELPPLRERADDIPALCAALLARFAVERRAEPKTLSPEAEALLVRYGWPGNVRELENVMRAVSLFADGAVIGTRDLVDYTEAFKHPIAQAAGTAWRRLGAEGLSLKGLKTRIEIECITEALQRSCGNITRAAAILGMKRPRLSQLIKEHGIPVGGEAGEER
ncbi:MAG: Nitrogenase (molybdenum-iron)-specific transcriptional regulator NifA, partial [Myxococcales bacterium]|nr:Nitrogenase (molybdenum-iron)-specific transcriptional regulator NifA [Myxococcales bacterium]